VTQPVPEVWGSVWVRFSVQSSRLPQSRSYCCNFTQYFKSLHTATTIQQSIKLS